MRRMGLGTLLAFLISVVCVNTSFAGVYIDPAQNTLSQDVFSQLYEKSLKQAVLIRIFEKDVKVGTGSGFIWTKDGYILTNSHVVRGVKIPEVYIDQYRHYPAKIVGQDSEFDVAVLKIDAGFDLTTVKIADSDQVKVGDWVYAIGMPYGLRSSLSVGVIGGLRRQLAEGVQEILQVDIALNPGGSGGPLYNLQGEVVGMNKGRATDGGIGFVIPINDVIFVAKEILQKGKVRYSRLGIGLIELAEVFNDEIAQKANLKWPLSQDRGVVIGNVEPNSPASKAGIRSGDIINSFNDQPVDDLQKFRRSVALSPFGVPIKMVVKRDGAKLNLQVVLVERPANESKEVKEEKEFEIPAPKPEPGPGKPDIPPAPAPSPVPQEEGMNFGEGINFFLPQVKRAIMEYQGLISEVSIGFGGQIQLRSTNAFAVDSQYVVTVASFLNPNAHYAFMAKYVFNGVAANLVSVSPAGLAMFKLESPYPSYKNPIIWSSQVKVGNVYHSLVIKNPAIGVSLPYTEHLLNKVGQILVFSARLKKIGYGAPVFNSGGEVVGMWFVADKNIKDPEDVYDSTIVLSADAIKEFVKSVIEQSKDKKEDKE